MAKAKAVPASNRSYIVALAESEAKRGRGKKFYDEAGALMSEAVRLGAPVGQKLIMPDGSERVLVDKLKGGAVDTVFVPAFFRRFELAEWKESKKAK